VGKGNRTVRGWLLFCDWRGQWKISVLNTAVARTLDVSSVTDVSYKCFCTGNTLTRRNPTPFCPHQLNTFQVSSYENWTVWGASQKLLDWADVRIIGLP
jgi:hypothetical protein